MQRELRRSAAAVQMIRRRPVSIIMPGLSGDGEQDFLLADLEHTGPTLGGRKNILLKNLFRVRVPIRHRPAAK